MLRKSKFVSRFGAVAAISVMTLSPALAEISGIFKTEPNEEGSYITVNFGQCDDNAFIILRHNRRCFNEAGEANEEYEHLDSKIVWKMEHVGQGVFEGGMIWAPDTDKTYNSQMELNGDTLTVEGCILFICRGQDWTRVQ